MDRLLGMIQEMETMYFRTGPNIRKCLVWSLNAEPSTRSVWKNELQVALELNSLLLNFIVLDMKFCEIKKLLLKKNQIYTWNVLAAGLWHSFIRRSKYFCIDFHYLFSFHMYIWFFLFTFFLILQNSMSWTIKLSSRLLSSRATCNSSFQNERVHSSAFCGQTKHFPILVLILKYIVLSPIIIPRYLSV
jgi:hypothetical protein